MTHQISVPCLWGRHEECTARTHPEYIGGIGPCRCIHHEPVHWAGDAPTSLHGNGASSFERTARDRAEVTCSLCLTLLDREPTERSWSDMDAATVEADAARMLGSTEPARGSSHG